MNNEQHIAKPWYRHPMVWLVIGIPLSSVVAGIWFIYIAFTNPNDVVNDNYYKDGLAINQQLNEDQQARQMGLKAVVSNAGNNRLSIVFNGPELPFVRFNLLHYNDNDQDMSGAFARNGGTAGQSVYVYQFEQLPQGRWYLELKGESSDGAKEWRLKGRVNFPLSSPVTLLPATL